MNIFLLLDRIQSTLAAPSRASTMECAWPTEMLTAVIARGLATMEPIVKRVSGSMTVLARHLY